MNKDEAERCTEAGLRALSSGDKAKALRLLEKSHRMFPTEESAALLEHVRKSAPDEPESPPAEKESSSDNRASTRADDSSPAEPAYTQEQHDLCTRVLRENDYYAVLSVSRDASEDTLKRAYKKLALQLHPDKNSAPNSEEAFKRVARVFQCLSDASKRAMYDRFGNDQDVQRQYPPQYDSDFLTPEDLFTTFFGMELDGSRVFRRVRRQAATPQQQRLASILQVIPVLVLLAISFFGGIFTDSSLPQFSLAPYPKFPVKLHSKGHNIRFFVPHSFKREYPEGSFARYEVERKVELKHFANMCDQEKKEIVQKVHEARRRRSQKDVDELIRRVQVEDTKGCSTYRELREGRSWMGG